MSGTYLYLVGPDARQATIDQVAAFRTSRETFENFLTNEWGSVRYPHEAFLRDAAAERAAGFEVYYLAHALIVNRRDVPSRFMDVELDMLFLDGQWLPAEAPATADEELQAFFRARRKAGFRVGRGYSEEAFIRDATLAGLIASVAAEIVLVNHLCNRSDPRRDGNVLGFPMWILEGWDNFEGYLTGAELSRIIPPSANGFLSLFKRAALGNESECAYVADRLVEVQAQAASLGPETLCVAVSSV
jgi:hypothetical protein